MVFNIFTRSEPQKRLIKPVVSTQKGFTIIELLIAISVFSVTILLVTSVVLGISKQYQKASYTAKLNDASRNFQQDIKDSILQGNTVTQYINKNDHALCTGNIKYYWTTPNTESPPALPDLLKLGLFKISNNSSDPDCLVDGSDGTNLLPKDAFVKSIILTKNGSVNNLTTSFAIGSADMFVDSDVSNSCLPTLKGGDFCSKVEYSSTIGVR